MSTYHAVMLDETGCEFGVSVPEDRDGLSAREWLAECYPESRCVQLETPEQTTEREQAIYDHVSRGGDWDEDGRPIYGADYDDYDDEEEFEEDWPEEEEDRHLDGMYEE